MKLSLKERLAARAFSHSDFDKADRLTKIYMVMMDPENFELNPNDETYAKRIHEMFHIMSEEYRQINIIKRYQELHPESNHSRVIKLIQDTQNIYGNITKRNAFFDIIVQRERLLKHLENCEVKDEYGSIAKSDMENIVRLEAIIAKLDERIAIMQPEEKGLLGAGQEYTLPVIQLSADVSLLKGGYDEEEE